MKSYFYAFQLLSILWNLLNYSIYYNLSQKMFLRFVVTFCIIPSVDKTLRVIFESAVSPLSQCRLDNCNRDQAELRHTVDIACLYLLLAVYFISRSRHSPNKTSLYLDVCLSLMSGEVACWVVGMQEKFLGYCVCTDFDFLTKLTLLPGSFYLDYKNS